jgi:hypothetical protein
MGMREKMMAKMTAVRTHGIRRVNVVCMRDLLPLGATYELENVPTT